MLKKALKTSSPLVLGLKFKLLLRCRSMFGRYVLNIGNIQMSLYNMTQGADRFAKAALATLHQPEEITDTIRFGRLRDAFFELDGDKHRVRVHTRNGGGNREEHQSEIDDMRSHPWFSFDEDCSHDCTYADFVFVIPDSVVKEINDQLKEVDVSPEEFWSEPVDHGAMLQAVLDKISNS